MTNNLRGELSIMDSLDIKPNYSALARKYDMDWRTVKNITKVIKENQKLEINPVDLIITKVKSQINLKSKELQSEVFMSLW